MEHLFGKQITALQHIASNQITLNIQKWIHDSNKEIYGKGLALAYFLKNYLEIQRGH